MMHYVEKLIDAYFACVPRQKPTSKTLMKARLIAHRGAHDKRRSIQENTMAAFQQAMDLGCYGIEFDVHASADGVIVVNHDPTLRRLWGHDVTIQKTAFDKLRTLEPNLPTLSEVIAAYGKRMHLFIEIKTPFFATSELAKTLEGLTPCVDYHLISLNEAILPALNLFPKEALLLVPIHNNVKRFCSLSIEEQYGGVLGHYLLFNDRLVGNLQDAHQLVGVGLIDSKLSLYRELNRELEFLFTDNASAMTHYLRELQETLKTEA